MSTLKGLSRLRQDDPLVEDPTRQTIRSFFFQLPSASADGKESLKPIMASAEESCIL
ncbi:MAG TPA: hypothetical protein VMT63_03560 [Bacteroidales bacterium]|nr:hypothetical protein [Bacteroidales bacterium]